MRELPLLDRGRCAVEVEDGKCVHLCRAMEELALRLSHCKRLHEGQDRAGLRKSVHRLIAIADQIGMALVARVAADVMVCIDDGDDIATAATLSRLIRNGERSLTAIWDLPEITI